MTEPPRYRDTGDDIGVGSGRESTSGTPWSRYVLTAIGIVLVLGFVLLHLTGVLGPGSH